MAIGLGQEVELAAIEVLDLDKMKQLPFVASVEKIETNHCIVTSSVDDDIRPMLFKWAVEQGVTVVTLNEKSKTIENVFMDLTR
jgi:ABC-2 type transport system ATP-binding protein